MLAGMFPAADYKELEGIGDIWNRENGPISGRRPAGAARLYFSQKQ